MCNINYRDYVWECDYGEHSFVVSKLKKLLQTQNAYELGYCFIYANNNPYSMELYIVFGYESPKEGQITAMQEAMRSAGAKYRPDLTNEDLHAELANKRFQFMAANDAESLDMMEETLFWYKDRSQVASIISMRPLGKVKTVFLSHSSYDKPLVEELIPYLNAKGLPFWYDKVSIDYGSTIVTAIQQGILDSGAAIFFITNHFLSSSWCKNEMEGYLNRLGNGHNILLLSIVDKDVAHECLPLFLQMKKYLRMTQELNAEAIATEIAPILQKHKNA